MLVYTRLINDATDYCTGGRVRPDKRNARYMISWVFEQLFKNSSI